MKNAKKKLKGDQFIGGARDLKNLQRDRRIKKVENHWFRRCIQCTQISKEQVQ